MSHVIATPEMMASAATDLATIGSDLNAAHTAAAASTVAVMPAAADEVSVGIAHLFSQHAGDYQALAARAAAFQEQFVQNLSANAGWYASVEAYITSLLQSLSVRVDRLASTISGFVSFLATFTPLQLTLIWLTFPISVPLLTILIAIAQQG
jgi:hypothetical protein